MAAIHNENEIKKEYLRGYERALRQQKRLEEEIESLRAATILPAINIDGMPHAHGDHKDLSDYIARLDQLERLYIKASREKIETRAEIMETISRLSSENEKDVLINRYVNLHQWQDICGIMNYEWAQIHRYHADALRHLKIRKKKKHDTQ